jgi:hypothetical protein
MSGGLFFAPMAQPTPGAGAAGSAAAGVRGPGTSKSGAPGPIDAEALRALAASLSKSGEIGPESNDPGALFAALLAQQFAGTVAPAATPAGEGRNAAPAMVLEGTPPDSPESPGGTDTHAASPAYGEAATVASDPALPSPIEPSPRTSDDRLEGARGDRELEGLSSAEAAASADPAATSAADDVSRPLPPDPDLLHPDLVRRVRRVIQRMEAAGHDVKVIEGYRTPERQQALWAQGRSEPGPVVTWTRHSRHSEGLAVDLMVNGGWTDREGYTTLQRVANEEGLRTLGPRDPGHLELRVTEDTAPFSLPEGRRAEVEPTVARAPEVARVARPAPTFASAAPAGVARVAGVASAAAVAEVARVATPGGVVRATRTVGGVVTSATSTDSGGMDAGAPEGSRTPGIARPATPAALPAPAPSSMPATPPAPSGGAGWTTPDLERLDAVLPQARSQGAAAGASREDVPTTTRPEPRAGVEAPEGLLRAEAGAGESAVTRPTGGEQTTRTEAVQATSAPDALGRIDRIRELAERAAPGPVRFEISGPDGEITRVRLGMLRNGLDASLDVRDPDVAREMRARIGELHRALEANSVRTGRLSVNGIAPVLDPAAVDAAEAAGTREEGAVRDLLGDVVRDSARTETSVTRGESRSDVRDDSRQESGRDGRSGGDDRPRDETRDEDRRELESWIELLERSRVDQTTEVAS